MSDRARWLPSPRRFHGNNAGRSRGGENDIHFVISRATLLAILVLDKPLLQACRQWLETMALEVGSLALKAPQRLASGWTDALREIELYMGEQPVDWGARDLRETQ